MVVENDVVRDCSTCSHSIGKAKDFKEFCSKCDGRKHYKQKFSWQLKNNDYLYTILAKR
jgi:hypothetical protein